MDTKLVQADTPSITPIENGLYKLNKDMCISYMYGTSRKMLTVPEGFESDGASIPRPLWSIIGSPFLPQFITAAIVHDYMCSMKYTVDEKSDLFYTLLTYSGVRNLRAKLMEKAVRLYATYIK